MKEVIQYFFLYHWKSLLPNNYTINWTFVQSWPKLSQISIKPCYLLTLLSIYKNSCTLTKGEVCWKAWQAKNDRKFFICSPLFFWLGLVDFGTNATFICNAWHSRISSWCTALQAQTKYVSKQQKGTYNSYLSLFPFPNLSGIYRDWKWHHNRDGSEVYGQVLFNAL